VVKMQRENLEGSWLLDKIRNMGLWLESFTEKVCPCVTVEEFEASKDAAVLK
jgi:hypothetical protein